MSDGTIRDLARERAKRASPPDTLRCWGTGRVADNPNAVGVVFSRKLTDEELRFFDDVCKRSAPLMDGVKR